MSKAQGFTPWDFFAPCWWISGDNPRGLGTIRRENNDLGISSFFMGVSGVPSSRRTIRNCLLLPLMAALAAVFHGSPVPKGDHEVSLSESSGEARVGIQKCLRQRQKKGQHPKAFTWAFRLDRFACRLGLPA
jgi:hypothetical protein